MWSDDKIEVLKCMFPCQNRIHSLLLCSKHFSKLMKVCNHETVFIDIWTICIIMWNFCEVNENLYLQTCFDTKTIKVCYYKIYLYAEFLKTASPKIFSTKTFFRLAESDCTFHCLYFWNYQNVQHARLRFQELSCLLV